MSAPCHQWRVGSMLLIAEGTRQAFRQWRAVNSLHLKVEHGKKDFF